MHDRGAVNQVRGSPKDVMQMQAHSLHSSYSRNLNLNMLLLAFIAPMNALIFVAEAARAGLTSNPHPLVDANQRIGRTGSQTHFHLRS